MLKKATCFISLFGSILLHAQPSITSSVIADTGTTSTFRLFDAQSNYPGPSGASVTWDFSSMALTGTGLSVYKHPSKMSGAGQFTGANLGVDQNGDPKIFFMASSQKLAQVGTQFSTITENYSVNPKDLLRFPMTYGTTYIDTFEGKANAGSLNADRSGMLYVDADAYGTLKLPYATFNNVLRVRTISIYEDKFLGGVVNNGVDTVYGYYLDGVADYLFTWSHITSTLIGSAFYGAFLDTMFVGSEELVLNDDNLRISPNPAQEIINISFESFSNDPVIIELTDISGKLIKSSKYQPGKAGTSTVSISINTLEPGMYVLVLKQADAMLTRKVLIE